MASSERSPIFSPATAPPRPSKDAAPIPAARIVPTPGTTRLATALPSPSPGARTHHSAHECSNSFSHAVRFSVGGGHPLDLRWKLLASQENQGLWRNSFLQHFSYGSIRGCTRSKDSDDAMHGHLP